MTAVALCSLKGSPGVTTLAAAIASTWLPERRVVLAELDPSGGDLAARFTTSTEKGVVSMAAAGRHGAADIEEHLTTLPGGLSVLLGSPSADQIRNAVSVLKSGPLAAALESFDGDFILDCGRIDSVSPAVDVLQIASFVVLVMRATLADVTHVAAGRQTIRTAGQVGVVVVDSGPYSDAEIADALDLPVLARIPFDRMGAAVLGGERGSERALRKSPLLRAGSELSRWLSTPIVEDEIEVAV